MIDGGQELGIVNLDLFTADAEDAIDTSSSESRGLYAGKNGLRGERGVTGDVSSWELI